MGVEVQNAGPAPFIRHSIIDRLPAEILLDIHVFLRSLPAPVKDENRDLCNESISAPTRISRVCRRWRELALFNPMLWSYLWIRNYIPGEGGMRNLVPLVKISDTWLSRTKEAPLNFRFECHLDEKDNR